MRFEKENHVELIRHLSKVFCSKENQMIEKQ